MTSILFDKNLRYLSLLTLIVSLLSMPPVEAQDADSSTTASTSASASTETSLDQIWFGPAKTNTPENWENWSGYSVKGTIARLDAESCQIRDSNGNLKTLELNRIVAVQPNWASSEAANMDSLFRQGKFAELGKIAPAIIQSNLPPWQQRLLLAELIVAADAIGNRVPAGKLFISLCDNSSPPFLYAVAPLNWSNPNSSPQMESTAEEWLSDSREAAQLLGASWLLSGPKRESAREVLEKLGRSTNTSISDLATCQLWRITPISPANASQLIEWQNRRDTLLLPLQIGPTELIADRWRSAQQDSLAAFEYLRIATLHRDRVDRLPSAQNAAEELLTKSGNKADLIRFQKWLAPKEKQ